MPHDTDLDIEAIQTSLSNRIVGRKVRYYDLLASTMDEAKKLAEQGEPEGTVIIAEEQTAARGRFNRVWVSPRGENLSFSVVLRPEVTQLPFMNMAASLAIHRTVAEHSMRPPSIKWPNDVRINGRKIAGILIETSTGAGSNSYAIVGIGLNVNLNPSLHPEISGIATSLFRETGERFERTGILISLLNHFDNFYAAVKEGENLTQQWRSRLDTLGRDVQVARGSEIIKGKAEDVDDEGNLILTQQDGSRIAVSSGEVTFQI